MSTADQSKGSSTAIELEHATTALPTNSEHLGTVIAEAKIHDGDEALKFVADHYVEFSPEEEKKVVRRIDFRMMPIMMAVNGIQFVDKLVCTILPEITGAN